jgi:hypothetical protein
MINRDARRILLRVQRFSADLIERFSIITGGEQCRSVRIAAVEFAEAEVKLLEVRKVRLEMLAALR